MTPLLRAAAFSEDPASILGAQQLNLRLYYV